MSVSTERTIAGPTTLEGHGVHSGAACRLVFGPSEPGSGIRFRRLDLDGAPEIPADAAHVVGTDRGTTLGEGDARVRTVEHVLAALASLAIDNVVVELDGPEVPILDGSFHGFMAALEGAGIVDQGGEARVWELPGPVSMTGAEGQSYMAAPHTGLRVSATIEFDHPVVGKQHGSFEITPDNFRAELAAARTFGLESEAAVLRERGLALGASLDNAIVLDQNGVMNEALRFPDEFVRHKIGDLVGDLALLGGRLNAHVMAVRPSHKGNVDFARRIAEHVRRSARAPLVDTTTIMEHLPHRYPMLLVDRITHVDDRRIVGIKNVSINEPFFQGHYPGHPIMPGVLVLEAMAQVGGLLLLEHVEDPQSKVVYFITADGVKWRRPITPGDTVVFELEVLQHRRGTCKMRGEAFVEGQLAAEAEFMARIVDK